MLNGSILLDIFTSEWPFCVHKLHYFSKITSSEIRECLVCIPTVPSIACEGNTSKIKQKREGNKRGRIREKQAEGSTGSVATKDCFLEQHYPEERGKKAAWTFHQDWGEQCGDKKPRAKMYKKSRKFRDKISFPVEQPVL